MKGKYTKPSSNSPKTGFKGNFSDTNLPEIRLFPVIQVPGQVHKSPESLDKLAQLENLPRKKDFQKKASLKWIGIPIIVGLANVKGSPLTESYWNSYHCCEVLVQNGKSITSKYCNTRWCNNCNRIRTAKMINNYFPQLAKLTDKQFLTLTVKNVKAAKLKRTIQKMLDDFRLIQKCFTKRKTPIIGIRKIECTYNWKTDEYHPHFHFIIEGKKVAEDIIEEWLKRVKGTDEKAQNVKTADDNSVLELFKYFTKLMTTNKEGKKGYLHSENLDVIFQAMFMKRVFQPMGIKSVSEDVENITSQIVDDVQDEITNWIYSDPFHDWFHSETGESFSGFIPSDVLKAIRENKFISEEELNKEFSI